MGEKKVQILITAKDRASKAMKGIKSALKGVAVAAAAAGVAFVAFAAFMKKAVAAANVQEKSEIKLQNALKSLGKNTKETREELQEFASSLQSVTTFGDEAIINVQALLASLGGLTGEGLKRATKATLDMAATLDQDLNSAAIIMAKAAGGMVSSLGRYGIQVDTSKNQTEQFAEALDIMEKKMGGAAAILSQTFEGALKQAKNSFGDLQEAIGFSITKSQAMVQALKLLRDSFSNLAEFVKKNEDLSFGETLAAALLLATEGFAKLVILSNDFLQVLAVTRRLLGLISQEELDKIISSGERFQAEIVAIDDAVDKLQERLSSLGKVQIELGNTLAEQLGLTDDRLNELIESTKNLGITLRADVIQAQLDLNNALELANLEFDKNLITVNEYKARLREVLGAWEEILIKLGEISETTIVVEKNAKDWNLQLTLANIFASRLTDQLLDAAFGADASFSKFLKNLLKGLAAAIVQAVLLEAILNTFNIGKIVGAKTGGVVQPRRPEFQHGGIVPGISSGRDSVPALLEPGEMVIPRALTDAILAVANRPIGTANFNISGGSDIEGLMDDINFAVERRGFRLVATETI